MQRLWRIRATTTALLAGALALTACERTEKADRAARLPTASEQVEQANRQTEKAYDSAKEAAEKAREEAAEAQRADEKVVEEQRELTEAQRKAQEARAEAARAQENARAQGEAAHEQARAAQDRAIQAQQQLQREPVAAPTATAPTTRIEEKAREVETKVENATDRTADPWESTRPAQPVR